MERHTNFHALVKATQPTDPPIMDTFYSIKYFFILLPYESFYSLCWRWVSSSASPLKRIFYGCCRGFRFHRIESLYPAEQQGYAHDVTNSGGKIMSLFVPDRHGKFKMVLGYDSANQYPAGNPYFGAMIGRFGNRIAAGQFTLER